VSEQNRRDSVPASLCSARVLGAQMRARWSAEIAASRDGDVADRQRGNESSGDRVNSTHEMLNLFARRIRVLRAQKRLDGAIR
jgi:hypothetical protein